MAGDHKCPVCSSTFTRPQHVARHMRSHTGDRPYKCQHCGDQFARSDLLSRHVNKCHAAEKPPTTTAPNNRRKGTAAASRATTSKQACDQCVTSSLPCDGCNPCSKCVQRKCRCTYVKFHRQTAPAGPGHPPPNTLPQHPHRSSISLGAHVPDEFILGPAPPPGSLGNVVPTMYIPHDYPLPSNSLYGTAMSYDPRQSPTPSMSMSSTSRDSIDTSPDMMARYRAQAALLSRAGVLPNGALGAATMADPSLYGDPSQQIGRYATVGIDNYGRPFPGGGGSAALASHPPTHGSASSFPNLQPDSSNPYGVGTGGGIPFPQHHSGSASTDVHANAHDHGRRSEELNDEFGSDSVPSSANSSSVHLPIDQHSEHGQSRMYAASSGYQHHDRKDDVGEGGFSSAFGLMSLDDPNVLAGISNDSEPFFSALNGTHFPTTDHHHARPSHSANSSSTSLHSDTSLNSIDSSSHTSMSSITSSSHDASNTAVASSLSLATPTPELIASLKNGGLLSAGGREILDSKELREFWKQYMRTPLTGPGGNTLFPLQTPTGPGQQLGSTSPTRPSPTRRHSRVASLPSMKTPPILSGNYGSTSGAVQEFTSFPPNGTFSLSFQPKMKGRGHTQAQDGTQQPRDHAPDQDAGHKLQYSSVRTTLHGDAEDLKSYEQAVLARKAPTTLNLVPRRRGTLPAGSSVPTKSGMLGPGLGASGNYSNMSPPQHFASTVGSLSQATNSSGSAYGSKLGDPLNRGGSNGNASGGTDRPGSSSNSSSLADAFGSSPSMPHEYQGPHNPQFAYHSQSSSESPPGQRESSVGAESDSGLSSSSPTMGYRPSFKRLASQTLGPANTKRALLGPAGWDEQKTSDDTFDEEDEDERDVRRSFTGHTFGHGASRRFSLPAGHGVGGGGGGVTLPPIRTAAEHAAAVHA